jgi:hypothetical protein
MEGTDSEAIKQADNWLKEFKESVSFPLDLLRCIVPHISRSPL